MSHRKKRRHIRWHSLYLWHRYMGLTAAAFVVILAVTGLMLNHTQTLDLDSRTVSSAIVLDWYGITVPDNAISFSVADHRVSQLGQRVFLDEREITDIAGNLAGAVRLGDAAVIATEEELLLITLSGIVIERLDRPGGLPADIRAVGSGGNDSLFVLTSQGAYQTDSMLLDWRKSADQAIAWIEPQPIPDTLYQKLAGIYRGTDLSAEQVILDIHSGRILGVWGVYVVDAAAILFILLAAAGIWIWLKRKH